MYFLKPHFITILLLTTWSNTSYPQNKIYLAKESRDAKVEDITAKFVTYTTGKSKGSRAVATDETLLIFNTRGEFLAPYHLDFEDRNTPIRIRQFLLPDGTTGKKEDEIYTISATRLTTTIIKEDNKFIYTNKPGENAKIDKRKITAIIYQTGKHVIYSIVPLKKIAEILTSANPAPPKASLDVGNNSTTTITATKAELNKNDTLPTEKTDIDPATKTTPARAVFDGLKTAASYKEFEEKAVKKTRDLNSYLKILCTKSYGYEEHNKALDQAIKLFISEDAVVNVSSINHDDIKSYKIRQYLLRIKSLNYDRVEVEWTNVQYVDKFKKGIDGNYYGTVSFEQVFRGFIDGKIVYEDITRKDATVVLKAFEKIADGNVSEVWDVLLSDIGIVYTKAQIKTP